MKWFEKGLDTLLSNKGGCHEPYNQEKKYTKSSVLLHR